MEAGGLELEQVDLRGQSTLQGTGRSPREVRVGVKDLEAYHDAL
jgi:hypothetical protein